MNLIRTCESRAIPVRANVLEPFRVMRNLLRWDPYRDLNGAWRSPFGHAFSIILEEV